MIFNIIKYNIFNISYVTTDKYIFLDIECERYRKKIVVNYSSIARGTNKSIQCS